MAQQQLVELKGEEYTWDDDYRQYYCTHINARIEGEIVFDTSHDSDVVVCDNPDCEGFRNNEGNDKYEELKGIGRDEYNDQD